MLKNVTKSIEMLDKLNVNLKNIEGNNALAEATVHEDNFANELSNSKIAIEEVGTNIAEATQNMQELTERTNSSNRAVQGVGDSINQATKNTKDLVKKQTLYNKVLSKGNKTITSMAKSIMSLNKKDILVAFVKGATKSVNNWLNLAGQRQAIEIPLEIVMTNMGATMDEIDAVRDYAQSLQSVTTFGDEMFLAGATELSRTLDYADNVKLLMKPLADMTAGLNGVNATYQDMAANAKKLGMALNGNYRQLELSGFALNEMQKYILETGTELERIAVLNYVVAKSFGGMAEALTGTPAGKLAQINNALDDIRETLGFKLYPAIENIINLVKISLPQIEAMLLGLGMVALAGFNFFASVVFPIMVVGFNAMIILISTIYNIFANNWVLIGPIVTGLVYVLTAYNAITLATYIKTKLLTSAMFKKNKVIVAQTVKVGILTKAWAKFNKVLLMNPKFWVAAAIALVIKLIVRQVKAVGGLSVAWLMTKNILITSWEVLVRTFSYVTTFVMTGLIKMAIGFNNFATSSANAVDNMKINVLESLEDLIDGSIERINRFIEAVNTLRFVNISTIDGVTNDVIGSIQDDIDKRPKLALAYTEQNMKMIEDMNNRHDNLIKEQDENRKKEHKK
jgi:hypothetical protein